MTNPLTKMTSGPMPRTARKMRTSRRGLLALPLLIAIIALAAVALASYAAPAQAQTVVDLVSNTSETVELTTSSDHFLATSFTTGSDTGGYTVSDVSIRLGTIISSDSTSLSIRENGSDNNPGDLVQTLTNPASFTPDALNVFTAPADTMLAHSTTYWISVNEGVSNRADYPFTSSSDQTGQTGWTIGDDNRYRMLETSSWTTDQDALVFRIRGAVTDSNTPPTASNGAVLTAVNAPYTFDADDFNFSDTDADDTLEKVKVVTLPTAGTLTLDSSNVSANDEITKTQLDADQLVFTPATGATGTPYTTFTFKVNDGDDDSAATYTTTVNVEAQTLISNTGQGNEESYNVNSGTAQRFTTGPNLGGYNIHSVEVRHSSSNTEPSQVSIYTLNSSGLPDTELTQLAAPGSFNGIVKFTTSENTILAPATTYATVIEPKVSDNFIDLRRTNSNNEDAGGADGWTIRNANDTFFTVLNAWHPNLTGEALMIRVKGVLLANTAPASADGSVTVPHNTRYTFEADDFSFTDPDPGSALGKIKIITLPTAGTITLDGTAVTANDEITRSDIDDDKLVFTPATGATGTPYTTFTFKVNDGDTESTATYTMTVNVGAACAAPTYTGDHVQIWTGTLTVGSFTSGGDTFYGHSTTTDPDTGALTPAAVRIGTTDYTATTVVVQGTGTDAERLSLVFAPSPVRAVVNSLTVYVCNTSLHLRDFTGRGLGSYYLADTGLNWSAATTRTLYISRDTTIPILQSAVIDGDSLVLTYNEALYESSATGNSAFDITIGTASAVNPSSFTISGKTVTLTLATAVTSTDTVTLAYTKPTTTTQRCRTSPATRQWH